MPRLPLSDEQRQTTRDRILVAAQELFDKSGIEAVSMRALGGRVGLTASALYAYFPTKIDLLRALWWATLDELYLNMQRVSGDEPDPIAAIRQLTHAYLQFGLENPARFRVLFMVDQGEFAAELRKTGTYHDAFSLVRRRVAEAIERGLLRITDADLATQVIWAGAHGTLTLTNSSASFPFAPPATIGAATIDALIAGLAADRRQKE